MKTAYDKLIDQVRSKYPAEQHLAVLKNIELKKPDLKGIVAHFLKETITPVTATPAPEPTNGTPEPPVATTGIKVPGHVIEELAKIATKYELPIEEVKEQWRVHYNNPMMADMGLDEAGRATEAVSWVLMGEAQKATVGGLKADFIFTLFQGANSAGTYKRYVPDPRFPNDRRKGTLVDTKICGGFGLFVRQKEDGELDQFADFIGAFEDETSDTFVSLEELVTYEGRLEKTKRGFNVPDKSTFKEVGGMTRDELLKILKPLTAKIAQTPSALQTEKHGKKTINRILDGRILYASVDVDEGGRERGSLKIIDSNLAPDADPEKHFEYVTFWGDESSKVFEFDVNSRVLVGVATKANENATRGYNVTGKFVLPLLAFKASQPELPEMPTYGPQE